MVDPWERQKSESSKSFAWFTVYRDLGPTRTLEKVILKIEELTKDDNCEEIIPLPTQTQLTSMSSKWHWVKRCRRYDNYRDSLRRQQKEQEYLQLEDKLVKIGEKLIDTVEDNIGQLGLDYESKPTSISHALKSAADAYDKGVKDLRLLFGMSTENKDSKVEASVDAEVDANKTIEVDVTSDEFMTNELEFMEKLIEKTEK